MKLATIKSTNLKNRNGQLILVSADNQKAVKAKEGESLLAALENWKEAAPRLQKLSDSLNQGACAGSFIFKAEECLAPLPNSPGFLDGSAFLSHVVRARKARGDVMPESAKVTPLMYQGVSDNLLSWNAPISLGEVAFGGDFEGEFGAITVDIPRGQSAENCVSNIALFTLFNDITLRELVKAELETKFGFIQSKPNSAFAPLVVTPDELGSAWDGKRISLEVEVNLNGAFYGNPNGKEMNFSFGQLIAHSCRTRPLSAGTIIGCGTVSNEDKARGFACLTEKRCQEMIDTGKIQTPWLKPGDRLTIDVKRNGLSVFGPIDEVVTL